MKEKPKKRIYGSLKKHSSFSKAQLSVFALIFVCIGGYLLFKSNAAAATCDLSATTSNFASQVSAASAGQTICLSSGNYGTWSGTNKAITIAAATGASPQMNLNLTTGDANFTLDGIIGMGGWIADTSSVTIKNSTFSSSFDLEGDNTNLVIDSNILDWPAASGGINSKIFFNDTNSGTITAPAVIIKNNHFANGDLDGVHIGGGSGLVIENNIFTNLCDVGANHTDNIQFEGGSQVRIAGNYVYASSSCDTQGITSFDSGTNGVIIENNVVDIHRPWGIELYSDQNSIIRHNTVRWYADAECDFTGIQCGQIDISRKTADPVGSGTQVYDNIATSVNFSNSSTGTAHHNVSGQTAIYVGPTTNHYGFLLAASSPVGKNAASDGKDIGIYALTSGTTPPPPPSDTTAPTVSLTSPISGATVSGSSVTLSANASDNIGVVGVQFKIDGNNVGSEDTTSPYSLVWDSRSVNNGSHSVTAVARDAAGNSTTSTAVTFSTNNSTSCSTSTSSWSNTLFAAQTGSFTFDYDATPNASNIDSITGLSNGPATDFASLAAIARFSNTGVVEARNGDTYSAVNPLSYTAGALYHFKFTVNLPSHTYSVVVTPQGGGAVTVASNYAFRTEQSSVSSLSNWATNSVTGSQVTCAASISGNTADTTAPTAPSNLSASVVSSTQVNLSWAASSDNVGVTSYDVYRNNSKIASVATTSFGDTGLSASTTYAYYVVARDAAGNSSPASSTVNATTQTAPVSTGNLIGVVKGKGNKAIAGATVSVVINGARATYTTSSSGSYSITGMPQGTHSVTYSATGYSPKTMDVVISANQTTTQNVTLSNR